MQWSATLPDPRVQQRPTHTGAQVGYQDLQDKLLAALQENSHLKRVLLENEQKMKRLVAQLARTEEAGRRAILRYDPSARRGAAQQLLELDREVARLTAAKIKAQKIAAEKSRAAAELSRTCSSLKKRLAAVLHDQRRLVVQLGLSQQKAGHRAAARHAGGATELADAGLTRQNEELERVAEDLEAQAGATAGLPSSVPVEAEEVAGLRAALAQYEGLLRSSKAEQLQERLEQSRAQNLAILQDLEAKNEELQSLRVRKLEQQGVINRLRVQLGFSGAQHIATAAGKSPGQSNTAVDELSPDDPNSITGKLSRLKFRQTRPAQLQRQQQQPCPDVMHDEFHYQQGNRVRGNPVEVGQRPPAQPPAAPVNVVPAATGGPSYFVMRLVGATFDAAAVGEHPLSQACATFRRLPSTATAQVHGLRPWYNVEIQYHFPNSLAAESLRKEHVHVDCHTLPTTGGRTLTSAADIPLSQLLDLSLTCQPKHVDLRDCSSGAVIGTLAYELELSQAQQHLPHLTSMPTQHDADVHSAPGPPYTQHAPQPSSRCKQDKEQPDGLPQNCSQQWQHPKRQAQPSSHTPQQDGVQQQFQAQPQATWDHLREPVRLLRLRPLSGGPPQLWPANGTHAHAAEKGDGSALSLRESAQAVKCSTCSDDASSADCSDGRGSQDSVATWPETGGTQVLSTSGSVVTSSDTAVQRQSSD